MHILLTPVATLLAERFGRRLLLTRAWLAMGASYALGAFALVCSSTGLLPALTPMLSFAGMCGVLAAFAAGPSCAVWLTVVEIFPAHAKDAAVALGVALIWFTNWVATMLFPFIHSVLGPAVLLLFAASSLLFAYFTVRFVPETRHRTVVEISIEIAERVPW